MTGGRPLACWSANSFSTETLSRQGCGGTSVPGFKITRATPEPLHTGTVCTGGTVCQAELVDRRLGDYFTIDIDWSGRLVAAYSDTRQGAGASSRVPRTCARCYRQ
jgi:hypothetical protein